MYNAAIFADIEKEQDSSYEVVDQKILEELWDEGETLESNVRESLGELNRELKGQKADYRARTTLRDGVAEADFILTDLFSTKLLPVPPGYNLVFMAKASPDRLSTVNLQLTSLHPEQTTSDSALTLDRIKNKSRNTVYPVWVYKHNDKKYYFSRDKKRQPPLYIDAANRSLSPDQLIVHFHCLFQTFQAALDISAVLVSEIANRSNQKSR